MGKMVSTHYLSVFSRRRVMVTGHTGFKGSWLTFLLNEIGAEVLGYALPAEQPISHFAALGLAKSIRHIEGDVRDGVKLADAMQTFQPEFVFHLAAQALVRPSYADPKATFETNVMGSVNLLEAVRQCESVRSLVYITSDKCYENLEWVWGYRENDRLGGHDPYSASKAAAEIAFSAYASSFFSRRPELGAATARAGNVIGGGRLGGGSHYSGLYPCNWSWQTCGVTQPQRYQTLAACSGATRRLSIACRAFTRTTRDLCRCLEFWSSF